MLPRLVMLPPPVVLIGLAALGPLSCSRRAPDPVRVADVSPIQPDAAPPAQDWSAMIDAWDYPQPIPDFELIDQEGRPFRLGSLAKSYVMVGFVFTRCKMPKACPLTMQKMREAQVLWADRVKAGQTRGRDLQLLTLTLDPTFDEPRVLRQFGRRFAFEPANWRLATGPAGLLSDGLPSLFNVLAFPKGEGELKHTVKVALLRPGLREYREWANNEFEAAAVIELILKDSEPGAP